MGFLFPKPPPPPAPAPPVPRIDDALLRVRDRQRESRRGAASTLLTSEEGLPDLGTVGGRSAYSRQGNR